jgi:hypothetical protein
MQTWTCKCADCFGVLEARVKELEAQLAAAKMSAPQPSNVANEIPASVVLTAESASTVSELIADPPEPPQALIDLMGSLMRSQDATTFAARAMSPSNPSGSSPFAGRGRLFSSEVEADIYETE